MLVRFCVNISEALVATTNFKILRMSRYCNICHLFITSDKGLQGAGEALLCIMRPR